MGKKLEKTPLRDAGLKVTHPRVKILSLLENTQEHHFRPEDIYRALSEAGEEVGLATVYRVLAQFEAAGLVNRHHFENGAAVYELNQGAHHDHLVCVRCNHVEEFVDELIEKEQVEIAKRAGFEITDHAMTIYGVCSQCSK